MPEKVAQGYWFVAPYWNINPEPLTQKYEPCQVGPHIYDSDGSLIWAGSCDFGNTDAFDFKVVNTIDDQPRLSVIIGRGDGNKVNRHGAAHVMSASYQIERNLTVLDDRGAFDIHEFNILGNGKTALVTAYRPQYLNMSSLGFGGYGYAMTGGFEEIDIATGEALYDWRSVDHISLSESTVLIEGPPGSPPGWDYLHVNSVDKNADGDYLISARFADTIYMISGETGKILWRLGGSMSTFRLENFRMYRQHHARFIDQNSTHITISFLNNASDEVSQDEHTSDALVVILDLTAAVARAILRYNRPDGGLSRLRGNVQELPTGNYFVGWSQSGYQSEFTPEGECVMQARFRSDRFSTYRSYKYEFHGHPTTPPDLKALVYESQSSRKLTVMYVSWNGATDISSWNFYAQASETSEPVLLGSAPKTGFETTFTSDGFMDWISVEAVHVNGTTLRQTAMYRTTLPPDWPTPVNWPQPDDPAVVLGLAAEEAANPPPHPEDQGVFDDTTTDHPNSTIDMDGGVPVGSEANGMAFEVLGGMGSLVIFLLVVSSLGGIFLSLLWVFRRRRRPLYEGIPTEEDIASSETETEQTIRKEGSSSR